MLWGRQIDQSEKPQTESIDDFEKSRWRERMWTDEDGTPMLPRLAINNCFTEGAKALQMKVPNRGRVQFGGVFAKCLLPPDKHVRLGVEIKDVQPITMFVPSNGKKGGGNRVNKIFAQIENWKATFEVVALDNAITKDVLQTVANYSGNCIALGAMRPGSNNCGQCGRFDVLSVEELESNDVDFAFSEGQEVEEEITT